MRQRFKQQLDLRTIPISEVSISLKSRDELPAILRALQYIFITPALNDEVFSLLEKKICNKKKQTGRKGMDLWHILVLAVVRHGCNTNWDTLETWANHHSLIRKIMGVHTSEFSIDDPTEFHYQTILDNVSLLDDQLLADINALVVSAGHKLIKKKDDEPLQLKTDSYVVESNVHFPTDLNLLWDSVRKCLDMIEKLQKQAHLDGWRKIKAIRKTFKSLFRATSQHVFKGKNEATKKEFVKKYIAQAIVLTTKVDAILNQPPAVDAQGVLVLMALQQYRDYALKFTNQIERRLLNGEVIPTSEKLYSIFETHTEWITKGKQNKKVELGHLVLITSDQYQFIVDYSVMEKQKDAAQVSSLIQRLKANFTTTPISSHSFDKGFFSNENLETLENSGIGQVVLPKKGKLNKKDKERETVKGYKKLRNAHSAVESNINSLEHHGLNRCKDKGLRGFKKCVGLSILSYNLHILGNALKKREKIKAIEKLVADKLAA